MTPSSMAPTAEKAAPLPPMALMTKKSTIGDSTGSSEGIDHLLDGGARQHVDGAGVIGALRALHDAGLVLELAAHLLDDGAGSAADGRHGDAAEQVGDETAEQEADDDVGVVEAEVDLHALEVLEGGRAARRWPA